MNIQYQRNLKNSYMVVVEPGQPLNMDGQLAEKMMQRQRIPGLLHWVTMENEGDMTFWYQITGLQSLSDWLTHHTLDYGLLGHLLSGLLALQEELPRFYLKAEHLFLAPDQIFLDTGGEQAAFCYEPLWDRDPCRSLRELMEQLLPKIDHADKDAVRLGYGLYEKCQEENADVWSYILEQNAENTCTDEGTEEPFKVEETERKAVGQKMTEQKMTGQKTIRQKAVGQETAGREIHSRENPAQESALYTGDGREHAQRKCSDISEKMKEKLPVTSALSWLQSLGKKKEKPASVYLFEPEEHAAESIHPTVCLGAKETAEGRLLYRGVGEESSFLIEKDSFLLGGRNEQADGQLSASGVSRNHARITKEDDQYYIEDLNSRNGTYLNGELLAYKQKCPVHPGDHLRFAREEYIFY